MIVVSRTLALITVALAVLAVTHFSATPQSGRPGPPRIETLAYASGLPETWASSVVPSLRALRPFGTEGEVREVGRLVDRGAEEVGVVPLLVLSVIQVESRFD